MKYNPAKLNKEINRLTENVISMCNIQGTDVKSILQNEISTTIAQFIETHDNKSNRFIVSVPLNDFNDIISTTNKNSPISIYIETTLKVLLPSCHLDDEGDKFCNPGMINNSKKYILLGVLTHNDKIWNLKLSDGMSSDYIDINLYGRCWNSTKTSIIRDFINDVYCRINQIGKYRPEGQSDPISPMVDVSSLNVITNESVSLDSEKDDSDITYELTYEPDAVIVKLHEFLNKDNDLVEEMSTEDKDQEIQSYLEGIFGTDHSTLTKIDEKTSNVSLVLGTGALTGLLISGILDKLGIDGKAKEFTPGQKSMQVALSQ